jgi:formylglycine-generating enzyme
VRRILIALWGSAAISFSTSAVLGVTIETVPVGNPGNANSTVLPAGAVAYNYRIGAYEVTNSQYADFLNAKAKSDPLGLYNANMATDARGGIVRSGSSPNFSYAVKSNMADKPVNYVSFYDTVRFTNWLNNGQGNSSTESGAYTVSGNTQVPSSVSNRTSGAIWFLPTYDEWYKAAYYDPRSTAQGGPAGDSHYWTYATQSDAAPQVALADSFGNISNPGVNVVNYNNGADWNGQDGNLTTVGSAGLSSRSFYGTFDQAGNAIEWNGGEPTLTTMFILGGAWTQPLSKISSAALDVGHTTDEFSSLGFRVANVPEPSTLALGALGTLGAYVLARKRRR